MKKPTEPWKIALLVATAPIWLTILFALAILGLSVSLSKSPRGAA